MDTSQRGMGFDWETARELIKRSVAEVEDGSRGACSPSGAGTDHLEPGPRVTLADVEAAYEEQCAWIEACGGRIILMASRALAACARTPDDYVKVYGRILSAGAASRSSSTGSARCSIPRWPATGARADLDRATETLLAIVSEHAAKIDGVKISLLDQQREIAMRRRFPTRRPHVHRRRLRLPDDDPRRRAAARSDALLGIFDVIAPAASAALKALDARRPRALRGDPGADAAARRATSSARPRASTRRASCSPRYLNGHQSHFRMVGGMESARSVVHLAEQFVLDGPRRAPGDPDRAVERMRHVLALSGIGLGLLSGGVFQRPARGRARDAR